MEWLMTLAPAPPRNAWWSSAWGRETQKGRGHGALDSGAQQQTDEALVGRIADGDERAFTEIVRRHAGRLRTLALRFAGGSAEADDIVQETFWTVWRKAKQWDPDGPPFAAYLTRIAINRAIDADRRRKVRRFFGLEDADEIADPAPAADDNMVAGGELAAVARDIGKLPARQRAAILLAADGERSNAEIAEAMNLSVGAVEQLLVRARRTLRAKLSAREDQGETM
jgi:RNA polymerase sigma-70 factor (ECF subfamily)